MDMTVARCGRLVALTILVIGLSNCSSEVNDPAEESAIADHKAEDLPVPVSIIQLKTAPEKFVGRWVRVLGFGQFGFEVSHLYASKEAAKYGDSSQELFVAGRYSKEGLNGKFVSVEAKFACYPDNDATTCVLEETRAIHPAPSFDVDEP